MLRLRPYKKEDAEVILSWSKDKDSFENWSGGRFGSYPITAEVMNRKYFQENGDCSEPDNFYPFTLVDSDGPVGHFILRYVNGNKSSLRVGWVIVDSEKRGRGYGKVMMRMAIGYAMDYLGADRVTLGVFVDNLPAYHCYRAAGFRDVSVEEFQVAEGVTRQIAELAILREEYEVS